MNHRKIMKHTNPSKMLVLAGFSLLILLVLAAGIALQGVLASPNLEADYQTSPTHPDFELLDENGANVLQSGGAISTMRTCGSCHDTEFISSHSFHASAGLESLAAPGEVPGGHEWDFSRGMFGRWNPLTYRYLSPLEADTLDLSTPDWVRWQSERHVGGGPAVTSRQGQPLTELVPDATNVEASALEPNSGERLPWDWQESGVVEMNCFLCHTPQPDNASRIASLNAGEFRWAATATLAGSPIVQSVGDSYRYNLQAFNDAGQVTQEAIRIQDPANANCGLCHGVVHSETREPLIAASCSTDRLPFSTTGQVFSPQRLNDSGVNLENKESLTRTWDVHAERLVNCTDCHFSLNNPVYFQQTADSAPTHLDFDPRRIELGEYLYQPVHDFARGESAQNTLAPELTATMRRCEDCHNTADTHTWLPYKERHMAEISCESCHIPEVNFSAVQQVDWTAIHLESTPITSFRGVENCTPTLQAGTTPVNTHVNYVSAAGTGSGTVNQLVTGYTPVLMPRVESDGEQKLAPYNLVTSWYWVYGDPAQPVRLEDLEAAYVQGRGYAPEVVAVFDRNADGVLVSSELALDTPEKEALIAGRLSALGLDNPRIQGEIQPYSINHGVTNGAWVTRDCQTCHSDDSLLSQPILLATYQPGGQLPEFVGNSNVLANGELFTTEYGSLYYRPDLEASGLYIFGKNRLAWVDILGSLAFVGVLLGIGVHGGLRFYAALRMPHNSPRTRKVYMYTVYERLWHWLQTFTILLLLFTGLIIHRPDTFGIFSFAYVVQVHNILGAVLLVNAGLALFYHLASGEIKQYLPRLGGFFDQAIVQASFYLRGIFRGDPHPFEKTPQRKLNPLQQVTYFGILNVLLPLQMITGVLMWGVQRFPALANSLGGLPFLAPFHTLIAWLFAAFIVAHVYLTTTGPEPLALIRAMMQGWDEVEILDQNEEASHHDHGDAKTSSE
jgi:thiosulfate reductase cytochrome b subunit